jgi:hypothetical protein
VQLLVVRADERKPAARGGEEAMPLPCDRRSPPCTLIDQRCAGLFLLNLSFYLTRTPLIQLPELGAQLNMAEKALSIAHTLFLPAKESAPQSEEVDSFARCLETPKDNLLILIASDFCQATHHSSILSVSVGDPILSHMRRQVLLGV